MSNYFAIGHEQNTSTKLKKDFISKSHARRALPLLINWLTRM